LKTPIAEVTAGLKLSSKQSEQLGLLHRHIGSNPEGLQIEQPLTGEQARQGLMRRLGPEGELQSTQGKALGAPAVAAWRSSEQQNAITALQANLRREPTAIQLRPQKPRHRGGLGAELQLGTTSAAALNASTPGLADP